MNVVLLYCSLLQLLLSDVKAVAKECPAVVPQLLLALQPQHRQHLAHTLQQLRHEYEQQHERDGSHCQVDHEAAAALVEELQHFSEVDVLLIIALTSQQQWEADVSLALMQDVLSVERYVESYHGWTVCAGYQPAWTPG
jgi:hypothetical protein